MKKMSAWCKYKAKMIFFSLFYRTCVKELLVSDLGGGSRRSFQMVGPGKPGSEYQCFKGSFNGTTATVMPVVGELFHSSNKTH